MNRNKIVEEAVENASDMDMCKRRYNFLLMLLYLIFLIDLGYFYLIFLMLHYIHDHLKELKFDGPDVLCSLDDGKVFLISGYRGKGD